MKSGAQRRMNGFEDIVSCIPELLLINIPILS